MLKRNPAHLTIDGVEYYPSAEVIELLKVSRATLWRWRSEGKIPAGHRLRGRQVVFTKSDLAAIREFALRVEPIQPEGHEESPIPRRAAKR